MVNNKASPKFYAFCACGTVEPEINAEIERISHFEHTLTLEEKMVYVHVLYLKKKSSSHLFISNWN